MADMGRHGRNLVYLFGAEAFKKVLSLVFFVYITSKLTVAENNWYGTYVGFAPVLIVILNMGCFDIAVREMARQPGRRHDLLPSAWILQALLLVPMLLAIYAGALLLDFPVSLQRMLTLGVLTCFFLALTRMNLAVFAGREQFRFVAVLDIAARTLVIAGGIATLALGYDVVWLVAWFVPVQLLQLTASYLVVRHVHGPQQWHPSRAALRFLLREGPPVAFAGLAAALYFGMDLPLLNACGEVEAAGYYATGIRFLMMLISVPTILAVLFFPMLSRKTEDPEEEQAFALRRCLKISLLLAAPAAVGMAVLGEQIVVLLAGERYLPSVPAVIVLTCVLALTLFDRPFFVYLRARSRQHWTMWVFFAAVAVKLSSAVVLIPFWGANVLLVANLVCSSAVSVALFLLVRWLLPALRARQVLTETVLRPVIAALAMGAALWGLRGLPILFTIPLGGLIYAAVALALGAIDNFDRELIRTALARKRGKA